MSETNDSIRITGVCGSLNADGATRKALAIALQGAAEYDAETTLLELRDFDLVFYGTVKDSAIRERLLNVGRQVVKFATVQRTVQQDEFMQLRKTPTT